MIWLRQEHMIQQQEALLDQQEELLLQVALLGHTKSFFIESQLMAENCMNLQIFSTETPADPYSVVITVDPTRPLCGKHPNITSKYINFSIAMVLIYERFMDNQETSLQGIMV
jgi:hypothetical protein